MTIDDRIEAELRLAQLLGWTNLFVAGGSLLGTPPHGSERSRGQAAVPRWTRDLYACGALIVEHDIDLMLTNDKTTYMAHSGISFSPLAVADVSEFDSKQSAYMCAAVLAAIEKLSAKSSLKFKQVAGEAR